MLLGASGCFCGASGMPLGAYSTHRNYPTKNIVKVPDSIDLEVAATLMTKGLTTFYLLHKTYPVKSGQTILFHAAAGGVGQIFGQWAKTLGCKLIGTVGNDEKIQKAKDYGYDYVINYNKENFSDKVLELKDLEDEVANAEESLKKLKENPQIIEKMSPQITLKKMNMKVIQPKSAKALYNLNRMTPEIANIIDME